MGHQGFDFCDDFVARPAHLAAAHVGHDAEATNFVAALHDRYEGFYTADSGSAFRIFHVSRVAVKSRLHRSGAGGFDLLDQIRQLVNVVRAEYQIEMGHALEQVLPFLLRHAAADADDHAVAIVFKFLPTAQRAVNFLLGLVAHAASVEQNQIRRIDAVGLHVVAAAHDLGDPFGIVQVHLAAVGLDK